MNNQKNEGTIDASKERAIARPELTQKEWIEKVLNDPVAEK